MSLIRPFRAYRPRLEIARDVASFPYDVLSSDEARTLAYGNPASFLHICKPEIDLDPAVDVHDDRVYAQGRDTLRRFISDGVLVRDAEPRLYVYQQSMGAHVQAGLVALCSVREYEQGPIKKHEHTRPDKEDDRTRHLTEANANAEPVFLAYRADTEIDRIVNTIRARAATCDFVASDGIGHALWVVSDPAEIELLVRLFAKMPALYIADGHHRTAAAARHAKLMRERSPGGNGNEPYESFMTVLFPHNQLKILDYNRLVRDLNGLGPDTFLAKVSECFDVAPGMGTTPAEPHCFEMILDGKWHQLAARPGTFAAEDPIRGLDVSILQDNLLAPVLGIADPRKDKRIDFVGGIRGLGELEKRCREGWAVGFALHPTSLDELMRVADAGVVMPPKSTWFEPKLRSGLFVNVLDGD